MRATAPGGLGLVLLLMLCFPHSATAQVEMSGVRAMGMGEAFTGGATGTGSLFFNPAGISALMMYSVETSYVYDQGTGRSLLHASIVDGKSNARLGGGIGYTYGVSPDDARLADFRSHDLYGALSSPVVPGWVILGVALHYLNYDQFGEDKAKGVTVDVGALLSLGDFISFGASARNLAEIDDSGRHREARFGLSYHSGRAHLGFDTLIVFASDETRTDYMAGLEVMALDRLPIRVGYRYESALEHHVVSGGLGWRSPTAGLDALYRQDVNESDNRMFGLAVNLYL